MVVHGVGVDPCLGKLGTLPFRVLELVSQFLPFCPSGGDYSFFFQVLQTVTILSMRTWKDWAPLALNMLQEGSRIDV